FGASSLNWRRVPERWHSTMIVTGILVAAASIALVALSLHGGGAPGALFFAAQVPFGLASGCAFSPLMTKALAGVRPADAADASGLVTTVVQLGQVVGLAALGAIYLALVAGHGSAGAIGVTLLIEACATALAAVAALLVPGTR
ncbi:MAG TPA: hypothetical protein VH442_04625, partial [Micromonosporaceae bacterium]